MPAVDAMGKDLLPGDHVFIPATVSKVNADGSVALILDHATHDEHSAHCAEVASWHNRPINQQHVPCPPPPTQTQTLLLDNARHVEFHHRPLPGSPIFDKIK